MRRGWQISLVEDLDSEMASALSGLMNGPAGQKDDHSSARPSMSRFSSTFDYVAGYARQSSVTQLHAPHARSDLQQVRLESFLERRMSEAGLSGFCTPTQE